jgi:hypothetical protein
MSRSAQEVQPSLDIAIFTSGPAGSHGHGTVLGSTRFFWVELTPIDANLPCIFRGPYSY